MLDKLRKKNLDTWLGGWLRDRVEHARRPRPSGLRHLLFAFCDHYEPLHGHANHATGDARVKAWQDDYPRLASEFRDSDGRPPRHSFFFPGEQYAPTYLDRLARLARAGLGEVELHLHHDNDTHQKLRADIDRYLKASTPQHGHLSRDPNGRLRYAFIHGNWCLANARADGRWCGVDDELPLLHDTGCFADFTFPSAPDECQPNIVNRIYWPTGALARRRAYETGQPAVVGQRLNDRVLLIEGPIALARRPGKLGVRIESAAITADDPGSDARVATWVAQDVHVAGRPEWVFVKVHTHGAPEAQARSLLGDGGRALHRALARYNDGTRWQLHYVTAREMYNIAAAAMDGQSGNPFAHRNRWSRRTRRYRHRRSRRVSPTAPIIGACIFEQLLYPSWEGLIRQRQTPLLWHWLEQSQWRTGEELAAFQMGALRRLLDHAYLHVPWYRERMHAAFRSDPPDIRTVEDLARLPILTRADARQAGDTRAATAPPLVAIRKQTSGTGGQPLSFGYDIASEHWRQAVKLRGYGFCGYRLGQPTLYYWGAGAATPPLGHARQESASTAASSARPTSTAAVARKRTCATPSPRSSACDRWRWWRTRRPPPIWRALSSSRTCAAGAICRS